MNNPITPPPELIQQWMGEFFGCTVNGALSDSERYLATQAARWGADQELEACCKLLDSAAIVPIDKGKTLPENRLAARERVSKLRAARRPKPQLELVKQAIAVLDDCSDRIDAAHENIIRRALEALDD